MRTKKIPEGLRKLMDARGFNSLNDLALASGVSVFELNTIFAQDEHAVETRFKQLALRYRLTSEELLAVAAELKALADSI